MFVKQLSIFVENQCGRLEQVTGVLKDYGINIISLSLGDTNEYGLLRMVVSDPEKAMMVLREYGFSAMLTDVLAIRMDKRVGMIQEFLRPLSEAGVNVEYMYVLCTHGENSSMIVKPSNKENALKALLDAGIELFDGETAYRINL